MTLDDASPFTHLVDCGHMAPYERPVEVAEHLAAFIDSHSDRIDS